MNNVRWSNRELRSYIEEESNVSWFAEPSEREDARARFTREARVRIVPVVQARMLERVGVTTDADGIALVATDLASDLSHTENARHWLLVCSEPWEYLTEWVTARLVKSYKATAGKGNPSDKQLKKLLVD